MIDGLGRPQHALIVGGTSEIGLAICKGLATSNPAVSFTLLGRSIEALRSAEVNLRSHAPVAEIRTAQLDLNEPRQSTEIVESLWRQTDFDLVLLTAGVLPEPSVVDTDSGKAVSTAMVNFVGQLAVGVEALRRFDDRGSGYLVVVSSVAAERIRPDNYVYGSTKSGLDGWAQGAAFLRRNSPVRVMVVRPGMVRTRMSAGMKEVPFTTDADDVASVVLKHLRRGPVVVWSPPILKYVMKVLRHLPSSLFFRMTNRNPSN